MLVIRTVVAWIDQRGLRMLDHLMPLLTSPWLYVIVFVSVAIDGFFPVVPSEAVLIGAAALSATGSPHVAGLAAAAMSGGVAGDRISYLIGRRIARRDPAQRPGSHADSKAARARAKAKQALLRHDGAAILVGRFLPYGRAATTVTSGVVRLPMRRFQLFSALASVAWAIYVITLGRLGGAVFAHSPLLGALAGMLLGVVLAAVCGVVEKRRKHQFGGWPPGVSRGRGDTPESQPGPEARCGPGSSGDRELVTGGCDSN
ncbi:hypothetical protein ADL15_38565 [Actinoplanes awajinensis subsp. mycoplanecinus]|uniref:VTT domain-containing protein n=1 Tax=Actinoplanes awajinensis subsp. mycoplanecinus TaxID=135947 RepID=A0A124G8L6_9ACTN|nr:hypothetical protein ADL15_38565 [Actinoplanes awajinensis subsp. mycoplanecinus]